MKKLLTVVIISMFSAKAFATSPICKDSRLPQDYEECTVERSIHFTQNGKAKSGQIVNLDTGMKCSGDICTNNYVYYLAIWDGEIIKIDHPNSMQAAACMMGSLGINPASSGGLARSDSNLYGEASYELKEGKLISSFAGKGPFTGKAVVGKDWECGGDFTYKPNVITWVQARKICEDKFTAVVGEPFRGQYNRPAQVSLGVDNAGYYYLCQHAYFANPNPQPSDTQWWYYRLDMDANSKLGPVLVKKTKNYYTATDAWRD